MQYSLALILLAFVVVSPRHVTGLECQEGSGLDDDETTEATVICEKGEVCYGRRITSDYYTSSGRHLKSTTNSYGCLEADDCVDDIGRTVESTGGGHFFTTYQYCCCRDFCTHGDDQVHSRNYANCTNVGGDATLPRPLYPGVLAIGVIVLFRFA